MAGIITTGIEAQPLFPYEDVSDKNADILELVLANGMVVSNGHQAAELTSWTYRVAHPAIDKSMGQVFDGSYVGAISHGMAVLEAMDSELSGMYTQRAEGLSVNKLAYEILAKADKGALRDEAIDALYRFRDEAPRTSAVVRAASERFVSGKLDHAELGAAVGRKLALDAVELLV